MKFAKVILASVVGVVVSASFAAASTLNSAKLDCSVVSGGLKDASQIAGFSLTNDANGSVQTISVEALKQHGCMVKLVPNTSGNYSEIAGSIFIEMKGLQLLFGYMLTSEVPQSCNGSSTIAVPLRSVHSSPMKIVQGCLGE